MPTASNMCEEVLFRFKEREDIREAILSDTGNIVEVYGPPMVGKSVLIEQAVTQIQSLEDTIYYKFWCKNIYVLQDLFIQIVEELSPNQLSAATNEDLETFYDMSFILKLIHNIVTRSGRCRHIFIFHKCESFHINGTNFALLSFLGEMLNKLQSLDCRVNVVLSTYKRFSLSGHKTKQVNVGMLINPCDIICLLSHYAPGVDIIDYVYLCQRYLCLPKPIVQLAISYISKNVYKPKLLEHILCKDLRLYSEIFVNRQYEVCNWLRKYELDLMSMICTIGFNPFSKDQVEVMNGQVERGDRTYQGLKYNLVIEEFDQSGQLIVHPLALYKCAEDYSVNTDDNISKVNSYTHFIGQVLWRAETNVEKHCIKGETYGCHRLEWHSIKLLCQAAISGDFNDILRVAVVARRLIMVLYPNEAKQFYSGLFETTQAYGSPREAAVMEACLGHITASGAGVNFQLALEHLNSAITTLKHQGPTFFYKWALRKKAIILHRVSRYPESLKYFAKAKSVKRLIPMSPTDQDTFCVSELQVEEDEIIGEIHETIPMIFSGDNERALKKLLALNSTIHGRYDNHPDYDVLLNNIGLAMQRGYKDLKEALKWYTKSLKQRSLLVRINPQIMLVTLNNVGMVKLRTGDIVGAEHDLQQAITILREGVWFQYNTALTLTHLAEIKLQMGKFQEAHDSLLKADEILQKINKTNDYRLKVNLCLFHYKLLLDHKDVTGLGTDSMRSDIERLADLGWNINKHMSDDSHHQLMSVYEHGMVVNWGVSGDKVRAHKEMLLKHVEDNAVVKSVLEKSDLLPGRQSLLAEHRHFLEYIKNTELDSLELDKLLDILNLSCPTCRIINEVLGQNTWLKDHLASSRQIIVNKDEHQLMESISSFSEVSSKTSVPLETLDFVQDKNNAPNKHPFFFMRRHNSEIAYLYHSGSNYHGKNNRQGISDNEDIVHNVSLTQSECKIINPFYSIGCNFTNALHSTLGSVVNPSTSFASIAPLTDNTGKENIFSSPILVNFRLSFGLTDQQSLDVVNPSKSVEPEQLQSPVAKISIHSTGQTKHIKQSAPSVFISKGNPVLLSSIVGNPSSSYGLKPSQIYSPAHPSILNPSSVYHCPCYQDVLNPSSVYHCPCDQDILNPSSVYHCQCEQDILNPSSVYNGPFELCEILSDTEVKILECSPDVAMHCGCSSFEFLSGLPELADRNALECNVPILHSLSPLLSCLDCPPSLHASTHFDQLENYIWVGGHLSEEHHDERFPSNPVYCLGSVQDWSDLYVQVGYNENCSNIPNVLLNDPIMVVEDTSEFRSIDSKGFIPLEAA